MEILKVAAVLETQRAYLAIIEVTVSDRLRAY